jgi:hypothetical protein
MHFLIILLWDSLEKLMRSVHPKFVCWVLDKTFLVFFCNWSKKTTSKFLCFSMLLFVKTFMNLRDVLETFPLSFIPYIRPFFDAFFIACNSFTQCVMFPKWKCPRLPTPINTSILVMGFVSESLKSSSMSSSTYTVALGTRDQLLVRLLLRLMGSLHCHARPIPELPWKRRATANKAVIGRASNTKLLVRPQAPPCDSVRR